MQTIIQPALDWFVQNKWQAFPFQIEAWETYLSGGNGLVNAPTGSGKTYSLVIPILLEYLQESSNQYPAASNNNPVSSNDKSLNTQYPIPNTKNKKTGLRAIWLTPIRALAPEIKQSAERAIAALGMDWKVGMRTGDTPTKERQAQKKNPPQLLITTPESLHLLIASKGYEKFFKNLKVVVADEWHELIGTKRGVQIELALSRFRGFLPELKTWGISATIGNIEEAVAVLMGSDEQLKKCKVIRSKIEKKIEVESLLPDEIECFPWAGHLGLTMMEKTRPVIDESKTTLIFTNTRAQCEIWYQKLLETMPDLAGQMAMHHGSLGREIRSWVEEALHKEQLKVVVCTSSLDLGVDFRPVETIIQIGSPKGVCRFLQRAGRSGHQPGATSKIYFVPTHSLELIESAALQKAIKEKQLESRIPYVRSFDVLIQFVLTLAVSDGFEPDKIYQEILKTFSYKSITKEEWARLLDFILTGGDVLDHYDEYKKVVVEEGIWKVKNRRIATMHRLSIGTIVSDTMLVVKLLKGKRIGNVEEWFIGQFKAGDVFWFAGRCLEFVRIKDMTVFVRLSKKKKGKIPSWLGGRLPLSTQLAEMLRAKINQIHHNDLSDIELSTLSPLINLQKERSYIASDKEFLVEYFETTEGHHLLMYPFAGRFVHEGLGTLLAYRISQKMPITFSIAMNDYGFELLSDQKIDVEGILGNDLFSSENLTAEIQASINITELANRRFRDIAAIAGLVFKGYPGKQKRDRHLQASSQLLFKVFKEHEGNNLLLQQAYEEVKSFQLEEARLQQALERIQNQKIVIKFPKSYTPFSFPIIVDRLRAKVSSEKLADRVRRMVAG